MESFLLGVLLGAGAAAVAWFVTIGQRKVSASEPGAATSRPSTASPTIAASESLKARPTSTAAPPTVATAELPKARLGVGGGLTQVAALEPMEGGRSDAVMYAAMVGAGPIGKADVPALLPILPLRNSVFFPGGVLPLAVGRQKTIALIKDAVRDEQIIGVVTQRRAEEEDPSSNDLYGMGTAARIVKLLKLGDDNYSLVVQGLARFRVLELVQASPYLKARVEGKDDKIGAEDVEVEALGINLKKLAQEVITLMPGLPAEATELVDSIHHPGHLADLIASNVDVPIEEKQAVLETLDLKPRMKLVLEVLTRKREILKVAKEIEEGVNGELAKRQRRLYLREQLKAIKKELEKMGEVDGE